VENTLKGLLGVIEVKANLLENRFGMAAILYNPDEVTLENLKRAVPGASGERHNFIVTSVREDV